MAATHECGPLPSAGDLKSVAWDRWAFAIAFAVWALSTVSTCLFVALHSSPIAADDDLELVQLIDPSTNPGWEFLWSQASEHRILLPRLVSYGLLALTHDFRAGMYFQVFVQSALALCLILFVRRLRGRSSFADAFFPLLLLNWGDAANLMLGVQMATSMSTALVCAFVMLALRRAAPPSASTALAMTLCVLLLPINGGFGLTQVPALGLWMAVSASYLLRQSGAGSRRIGLVLAGGVFLLAGLVAFYFVDFYVPATLPRTHDPIAILGTAIQFLSLNFGPGADSWRVSAQVLAIAFAGLAVWAALRAWPWREERWRASAVLAGLAAACTIALSIGVSRSALGDNAGLAPRYVILPAPFFVTAYLGLCLFGPRRLALAVQGLMCVVLLAVQPLDFEFGVDYSNFNGTRVRKLVEALDNRLALEEIAPMIGPEFYPDADGFLARFDALRRADYPPFRGRPKEPSWREVNGAFKFEPRPRSVDASKPAMVRSVYDALALTVCADSTVVLAPPAGARELSASYGLLPIAWESKYTKSQHSDGIRFAVEWRVAGTEPRVLFERELRPFLISADRGVQSMRVVLPEERPAELVLTTRHLSGAHGELDWSFWRDVAAR